MNPNPTRWQQRLLPLLGLLLLVLGAAPRAAAQVPTQLPPRMFADSAHAPFLYGVASGDPLPDGVLLWTRVEADSNVKRYALTWQVATDSLFQNVVSSGTVLSDSSKALCFHADARGLQPDQVYFYRFADSTSRYSDTGRTRTAPADSATVTRLRFGVASCSSVYSGYYNAYARMAERRDLTAVIHLGDYIYDTVDPEERVRVPVPAPQDPITTAQWEERHRYNLLDPDFRAVRKNHPFITLWDNHDVEASNPLPGARAFWNYTPTRRPDSTDESRIFRKVRFGKLVDVLIFDMLTREDPTSVPDSVRSILGTAQETWLYNEIATSQTQWRVLGAQKMIGQWLLNGIPGRSGDQSGWNNHPGARARLLQHLRTVNQNDNLFISGDAHVSMAQDLAPDPFSSSLYTAATGQGSFAIEFLPSSITRGNLDEITGSTALANLAVTFDRAQNPHHLYQEFIQHGYGVVDLQQDSLICEFWYCPILQQSTTHTLARSLVSKVGQNRWFRPGAVTSTQPVVPAQWLAEPKPNPATDRVQLGIHPQAGGPLDIRAVDALGRTVSILWSGQLAPGLGLDLDLSLNGLSNGVYTLVLASPTGTLATRRLVVQRP